MKEYKYLSNFVANFSLNFKKFITLFFYTSLYNFSWFFMRVEQNQNDKNPYDAFQKTSTKNVSFLFQEKVSKDFGCSSFDIPYVFVVFINISITIKFYHWQWEFIFFSMKISYILTLNIKAILRKTFKISTKSECSLFKAT
jgi:hypothetical protein